MGYLNTDGLAEPVVQALEASPATGTATEAQLIVFSRDWGCTQGRRMRWRNSSRSSVFSTKWRRLWRHATFGVAKGQTSASQYSATQWRTSRSLLLVNPLRSCRT